MKDEHLEFLCDLQLEMQKFFNKGHIIKEFKNEIENVLFAFGSSFASAIYENMPDDYKTDEIFNYSIVEFLKGFYTKQELILHDMDNELLHKFIDNNGEITDAPL